VKVRAAVLPRTGARLEVAELDLAGPGPGEVLVRVHASGVCHSDLNAIDGTAETPCPAVLGHEGAGVVEAVGEGVTIAPGTRVVLSWMPACGTCEECTRGLVHLCGEGWRGMEHGGLLDGTTRLSRDGEPIFHYCYVSTFAERAVVPAASCIPIPDDVPFEIGALVGCAVATGIGSVWNTASVRPGERVAVIGCGGVGLSAIIGAASLSATPIVAVDVAEERLAAALDVGATVAVRAREDAEATAAEIVEAAGGGVDYAIEATGRPGAMLAAFLATRKRGAAVMIGIAPSDGVVPVPPGLLVRGERRILGSVYGSVRPERDFPRILELYRRGVLPLDRLVSHRLPLEEIETAFELMHARTSRRVVLDLDGSGA
jgi:Zn-dependent alcohol dehydrogenase